MNPHLALSMESKSLLELNPKSTSVDEGLSYVGVCADNFILSTDILVEIFLKLPDMDMVRCKLVSKSWKEIITKQCIPLLNSRPVGFIVNSSNEGRASAVSLKDGVSDIHAEEERDRWFGGNSLPFTPSPSNLVHCSNGCFLLFEPTHSAFYVYNPVTKHYVQVHYPKLRLWCDSAGLVFDDSSDNSCFYIVYVQRRGKSLVVNVWSSFGCSWRRYNHLSLDFDIMASFWIPRYVFLGQSFYRLSCEGYLLKIGFKEKRIATIRLPEIVRSEKSTVTFGVSRGQIHYALSANDKLMVWMLNGDDPIYNWSVKYTLPIKDFGFHFNPYKSFLFYDFHPTSDILFLGHEYGVFGYDPISKKTENIFVVLRKLRGQRCIFPFTRNLSALDGFKSSRK